MLQTNNGTSRREIIPLSGAPLMVFLCWIVFTHFHSLRLGVLRLTSGRFLTQFHFYFQSENNNVPIFQPALLKCILFLK
jgi:hypothetical protein